MCGLRTCFLCLVVAFCLLFGVSHATNESVCVLSDAPQQCSAFCLGALHPLCDQYAKSKQKEEIVKMIAESRAEQMELVNDMVKLTADSRTEQKKLANHSQEAMEKLIADSQAEQKELVNRSQEEMVKMIADSRTEQKEAMVKLIADSRTEQKEAMVKLIADSQAEQKKLLNVLAANITSTASKLESTLQEMPSTLLPVLHIGSRYYFIEYKEKSMTDAEKTCREKGGQLATFGNEDEFEAVTRNVNIYTYFWLGYRRNSKGEFETAAGNKGSFMKWESGQPDNIAGKENCVFLFNSHMYDWVCEGTYSFICQLDAV
ncbi:low affinity immunoglobulin epsilon Fc receptor-like [Drosophila teissieri]|uniref:low affinity immunoglobulin epsilon Fc receptor-like n=1 Tax=Drosophila teissieri TaxID=7243 RepID=UPI001CBA59B9|nr:low affinity immunoglobulin epsilon Fc receptor-like [Drosophila teissieri]